MESNSYNIRVALYPFTCPRCGIFVRRGTNYIDHDGISTCLCILPRRRLIPTGIRRLLSSK